MSMCSFPISIPLWWGTWGLKISQGGFLMPGRGSLASQGRIVCSAWHCNFDASECGGKFRGIWDRDWTREWEIRRKRERAPVEGNPEWEKGVAGVVRNGVIALGATLQARKYLLRWTAISLPSLHDTMPGFLPTQQLHTQLELKLSAATLPSDTSKRNSRAGLYTGEIKQLRLHVISSWLWIKFLGDLDHSIPARSPAPGPALNIFFLTQFYFTLCTPC